MPLLGHGNEIKSPNWACRDCGHEIEYDEVIQPLRGDQGHIGRIRHSDACEPWGYVAPAVAAVMTRATGVRHIYLILYQSICEGIEYLFIQEHLTHCI